MEKEDWTTRINELEKYYGSIELPITFELFKGQIILDVPAFVKSHLSFCKHNNGRIRMKPYFYRLIKLKNLLNELQN